MTKLIRVLKELKTTPRHPLPVPLVMGTGGEAPNPPHLQEGSAGTGSPEGGKKRGPVWCPVGL